MPTSYTPLRTIPTKARPVDFVNQHSDHECALLAAMGFSTHYIKSRTNLSECQISYRIRKAGLTRDNGTSRMDFRNGTSPFAKPMLQAARTMIDQQLVKFLNKYVA